MVVCSRSAFEFNTSPAQTIPTPSTSPTYQNANRAKTGYIHGDPLNDPKLLTVREALARLRPNKPRQPPNSSVALCKTSELHSELVNVRFRFLSCRTKFCKDCRYECSKLFGRRQTRAILVNVVAWKHEVAVMPIHCEHSV